MHDQYRKTTVLHDLYRLPLATMQEEQLAFIRAHIPPDAKIIIDDDLWVQLHDVQPFYPRAHSHWKASSDPAVRDKLFAKDWRNIDYIVMSNKMLLVMQAKQSRWQRGLHSGGAPTRHADLAGDARRGQPGNLSGPEMSDWMRKEGYVMNSWKNRRIQQEKMNQSAEDDEIVDLSTTEEQMIDQPIRSKRRGRGKLYFPKCRGVLEGRVRSVRCSCRLMLPSVLTGGVACRLQVGKACASEQAPSPGKGTPAKHPKKGRMNRGKLLWIGLAGIVAVSVVFGILSQTWSNVAVHTTGSSTPQATPATSNRRRDPGVPAGVTAGALILLNPGVVRQGASMGVTGTGFDPRATVDVLVKQRKSDTGQPISLVHADKYGNFYDNLTVPETLSAGPFFIETRERSGNKVALAAGVVAGGTPQLKLDEQVGPRRPDHPVRPRI